MDGGWDTPRREERHGMTIAAFEAAMCGLFTAIEKSGNDTTPEGRLKMMLEKVDWGEVGVKRKTVEIWWKKHKAEDEERRARERAARRKEELKASGLSKLTPEEKVALGIK
jgi:hypothetical protein